MFADQALKIEHGLGRAAFGLEITVVEGHRVIAKINKAGGDSGFAKGSCSSLREETIDGANAGTAGKDEDAGRVWMADGASSRGGQQFHSRRRGAAG